MAIYNKRKFLSPCKIFTLLIPIVVYFVILTILHTRNPTFTSNFVIYRTERSTEQDSHKYLEDDYIESLELESRYDASTKHKIISYIHTADNWTALRYEPLCIALHCSLNRADAIPKYMETYSGPASAVIFAPGEEFQLAIYFIQYLLYCYPSVRDQVSIHIVFTSDRPPSKADKIPYDDLFLEDCSRDASEMMEILLSKRSNTTLAWRTKLLFPHNVNRNFAREHCQTTWVANIDSDMVFPRPSPEVQPTLIQHLHTFLKSPDAMNCYKCAFVMPLFEISFNVSQLPANKVELQDLAARQLARSFYSAVFVPDHGPTQAHEKWLKLPYKSKSITMAYKADYKFKYEPVYISKRGVPRYDERYVQYGMDRDSQAYEMYLAGYTFYILDNIFLNHWGFKSQEYFTEEILEIIMQNVKIFRTEHYRELIVKYDQDPLKHIEEFHNQYGNKFKSVQIAMNGTIKKT